MPTAPYHTIIETSETVLLVAADEICDDRKMAPFIGVHGQFPAAKDSRALELARKLGQNIAKTVHATKDLNVR